MLLGLVIPAIAGDDAAARRELKFFEPGEKLAPGRKLADISIDLSASFGQDCPPISYYRLISREVAFVRRILAAPGEMLVPGQAIAVVSTTADEPADGEVVRALRLTTAGILGSDEMWSHQNAS
jgi:hypothetical protein